MHLRSIFFDILTIFAAQMIQNDMKRTIIPLITAALMAIACGSNETKTDNSQTVNNSGLTMPGDSTIYGLACDGCTDSLLILMPLDGSDPDTFNIFSANLEHKIYGRPSIGDRIAIVPNGEDSTYADMVINIDRLQGEWRYQVRPRLRRHLTDSTAVGQEPVNLPDSFVRRWLQPKEYGYDIRRDNVVRPVGAVPASEAKRGPVEYPALKRYREWHILNGHILFHETRRDTTGLRKVISTDTADIVLLRRDTLVLRFANHVQGFYRDKKD